MAGFSREQMEFEVRILDQTRHLIRQAHLDGTINGFHLNTILDDLDAQEQKLRNRLTMIALQNTKRPSNATLGANTLEHQQVGKRVNKQHRSVSLPHRYFGDGRKV